MFSCVFTCEDMSRIATGANKQLPPPVDITRKKQDVPAVASLLKHGQVGGAHDSTSDG